MSPDRVRIGTRGSKLAVWQAQWVADRLGDELPGVEIELLTVTTRGDTTTGPLTGATGEIGFFTSEIEEALKQGRVDLAVHSLKDLPTAEDERLPLGAVPVRHDAADVLVALRGRTLDDLPIGARVGTSSPRRASLVRSRRRDVSVVPVRGNVDTRVAKMRDGEYDAVVLAAAGLQRLGLEDVITERFEPRRFPPAPGQGALAVQVGDVEDALLLAVERIDDFEARRTTTAERTCLEELGGGCARPVGAYAWGTDEGLELSAFVGSSDGAKILRAHGVGLRPEDLGREVASELRRQGAEELLT